MKITIRRIVGRDTGYPWLVQICDGEHREAVYGARRRSDAVKVGVELDLHDKKAKAVSSHA